MLSTPVHWGHGWSSSSPRSRRAPPATNPQLLADLAHDSRLRVLLDLGQVCFTRVVWGYWSAPSGGCHELGNEPRVARPSRSASALLRLSGVSAELAIYDSIQAGELNRPWFATHGVAGERLGCRFDPPVCLVARTANVADGPGARFRPSVPALARASASSARLGRTSLLTEEGDRDHTITLGPGAEFRDQPRSGMALSSAPGAKESLWRVEATDG